MIAITGSGRSGTSLIAKILSDCGLSLGADSYEANKPPYAGMEVGFVSELNVRIISDIVMADNFVPTVEAIDSISKKYKYQILNFSRKWDGLKQPLFCRTLPIWHKIQPIDHVVLCLRDPLKVAESAKARRMNRWLEDDAEYVLARAGAIFSFVETECIPYTVIRFPKVVDDPKEILKLSCLISDTEKLMSAYNNNVDRDLVHFR